jgi:hypothetical protein
MTPEEIRAAFAADTTLAQMIPDWQGIADILSAGRTKFVYAPAGKGDIIALTGFEVGNAFCDVIDNDPTFRHVKHLLEAGRMDVSLPLTRMMIQSMVGVQLAEGIFFTQEHANALYSLSIQADPVNEYEVRRAILNNDGSLAV